jgi:hypothetical protein
MRKGTDRNVSLFVLFFFSMENIWLGKDSIDFH